MHGICAAELPAVSASLPEFSLATHARLLAVPYYCAHVLMPAPTPCAAEAGGAGASGSGYVNLAQYSEAHRNADTSLYALYGDNAMWIEGGGGAGSRARTWQQLYGRRRR